jgi:hypothetical protein
MASGPLYQSCLHARLSHGFLDQGFVNVIATLFFCLDIGPPVLLREYPLPTPLCGYDIIQKSQKQ